MNGASISRQTIKRRTVTGRGIFPSGYYFASTITKEEEKMARISVYELMRRSVNNMGAVNSKVKDLALELIKLAYHEGINVQITSGYRSNAEQQKLYNQGRYGNSGNVVTNAGPGQSVHNYGYAIDFALASEDGSRLYWDLKRSDDGDTVADWLEVAQIGKMLGFQWGGEWKSFPDPPHLDMGGLSWRQLQAGQRPRVPNVPERNYLGIGDSGPKVEALQKYLNQVGIKVATDGDYGPATEAAVKLFQRKRKITSDGFYGPGSLAEMNKALKELKQPKPAANPTPAKTAAKEEPTMAERIFEEATTSLAKEWEEAHRLKLTDGANPDGPMTRAQGAAVIIRALDNEEVLNRIADKVAEKIKK